MSNESIEIPLDGRILTKGDLGYMEMKRIAESTTHYSIEDYRDVSLPSRFASLLREHLKLVEDTDIVETSVLSISDVIHDHQYEDYSGLLEMVEVNTCGCSICVFFPDAVENSHIDESFTDLMVNCHCIYPDESYVEVVMEIMKEVEIIQSMFSLFQLGHLKEWKDE